MGTPAGPRWRLELIGVSKSYPLVKANEAVDLRVAPGEIHAIVGENGAGKSTLMKIIYGLVQPDSGAIVWEGREVEIRSPNEAQKLGIGMVFQHFALFDTLTVAENIALALPSRPSLEALSLEIRKVAVRYGLPVDPNRHIYTMSVGERQRVEIIRALLQSPGLLILDEPTSVLTPQAVKKLFVTLRQLADEGCSILYISHKLDEVRTLCSGATIMRGGKVVGKCDPRRESASSIARMMIGGDLHSLRPAAKPCGEGPNVLALRDISVVSKDPFGTDLNNISLDLKAGEIVGIAGVSGNGQKELMEILSGEKSAPKGCLFLHGQDISMIGPRERRRIGLCSVPEDRLGRGAVPSLSLAENALLTATADVVGWGGLVRSEAVHEFARRIIGDFGVKTSGVNDTAGALSGGNLQKFIIGREILNKPKVLVVAQPTWGVDVAAAITIRKALLNLRDQGVGLLIISEEIDELLEISDRIAVISNGSMTPARPRREFSREAIGMAMTSAPLEMQVRDADVATA
nr:ABC transporter ATP-binding protein [Halovulum dunhuangense]